MPRYRMGGSRRHKPNTIHKLSLHRQASVSRKMITMEPKRWVDYEEPSRLQSLGEDKRGTGFLSDSKAGRVDRQWVQHGARLLKFTALHTGGHAPFPVHSHGRLMRVYCFRSGASWWLDN